jgi:ankyrin repeat protein
MKRGQPGRRIGTDDGRAGGWLIAGEVGLLSAMARLGLLLQNPRGTMNLASKLTKLRRRNLDSIVRVLLLLIPCVGCEPMTDIQKAAQSGSIEETDALLARGADINYNSPIHGTALTVAAWRGDTKLAEHLLDKGADVNLGSPLAAAAYAGKEDLARLLVAKGANVNDSRNSDSPLDNAAQNNHANLVTLLLKAGANPNGGRAEGHPLYIASYKGYDDIVAKLLKARADPNQCNCLSAAIWHSPNLATTRLLLEHGANVNFLHKDGGPALHVAAGSGRIEHVRLLLAHGANPNLSDKSGKRAVDYALQKGFVEIAALLNAASIK